MTKYMLILAALVLAGCSPASKPSAEAEPVRKVEYKRQLLERNGFVWIWLISVDGREYIIVDGPEGEAIVPHH